jgi:hypothetical protein
VIGLAAAWESETPVKALLDAGAGPDPVGSNNLTPLRQTGAYAKVSCVKVLKFLYEACELRYCGRLPVELYRHQVLESEEDEVMQLNEMVEELMASRSLPELWEFICGMLNPNFDFCVIAKRHITILALGVELRASIAYENCRNESSLVPLFSGLRRHHMCPESLANDTRLHTTRSVIFSVIRSTERLKPAM